MGRAQIVSRKEGEGLRESGFDPDTNELCPHIRVVLNGQNIDLLEGLETKVEDRDVITVFLPAGGG
ncbi:MAG: MoaD/ThiS family protein [Candidatus Bathyarchaeia archaeon]